MKQNVICILASGSPRRRELLEQAGIRYEILVSEADETSRERDPAKRVMELARKKGRASAEDFIQTTDPMELRTLLPQGGGVLIIAADTLVFAESGGALGKPHDRADALHTLMMLSGQTHAVYTGVYLELLQVVGSSDESFGYPIIAATATTSFFERTEVEMYPFAEAEAIDYISTGEPMDKAGAYGIQGIGARLVKEIRGDYNNVVGFPLAHFMQVMREKGYISFSES